MTLSSNLCCEQNYWSREGVLLSGWNSASLCAGSSAPSLLPSRAPAKWRWPCSSQSLFSDRWAQTQSRHWFLFQLHMYRGFLLHHFKNAVPLSHIDPDFRPAFTCLSTFLSSAAESSLMFPVVWINFFFGRWDFHSHSSSTDNSLSKSSCFSSLGFPSLTWESGHFPSWD